ncbi:MAG TPA: hypothetical protein VE981_10485 [Planctomycetota bacterium]|nr:hypothetical protein [Planctomycetota bacterium]
MTPSERYQLLTQIFISVCSLGQEERCRELDRLCRDHADLRPEIELLLAFHDSVSGATARPEGSSATAGKIDPDS